ncbi:MAG: hypothetical protein ACYDCK_08755, partial [Thermoplasmatota archaeon]
MAPPRAAPPAPAKRDEVGRATPPRGAEDARMGEFWSGALLAVLAALVGVTAGFMAIGVRWIIALTTNLFFYGTLDLEPRSPGAASDGIFVVLNPVVGAL